MTQVLEFFFEAPGPREGLQPDLGHLWLFASVHQTLEKRHKFRSKPGWEIPVHFRANRKPGLILVVKWSDPCLRVWIETQKTLQKPFLHFLRLYFRFRVFAEPTTWQSSSRAFRITTSRPSIIKTAIRGPFWTQKGQVFNWKNNFRSGWRPCRYF